MLLAYHTVRGRALIDRELYLPKCWTEASDRRVKAHVPDEAEFATKPEQTRSMLQRAIDAKVPFVVYRRRSLRTAS